MSGEWAKRNDENDAAIFSGAGKCRQPHGRIRLGVGAGGGGIAVRAI
jgi:hypothetical protein